MRDLKLTVGDLTLSPLSPADVNAHLAGEDDLLVRWLNGGPGTRAGTEKYIRHCMDSTFAVLAGSV